MSGQLFLVGTPIGNLEDMTYRAVRTLQEVDRIAAEDTRKAKILLNRYEIKRPVFTFFDGNESAQTEKIVRYLEGGESVAVISEAGMPGISDPGYRLIQRCIELDLPIDVIPGPSSVTTALLLSGLPLDAFYFCGFLPRKGAARKQALAQCLSRQETAILFESPNRLAKTLAELGDQAPTRQAAVTRELTKLHQEVQRGTLTELHQKYQAEKARGEITLVIAGRPEMAIDHDNLVAEVKKAIDAGQSPKQIAEALADVASKREIYQLALKLRSP